MLNRLDSLFRTDIPVREEVAIQYAAEIDLLEGIRLKTDSETADRLAKAQNLLRRMDNGDSFSMLAERLEQAAKLLRGLTGLDAASHNDLCLMAERFDETVRSLIAMSNETGY